MPKVYADALGGLHRGCYTISDNHTTIRRTQDATRSHDLGDDAEAWRGWWEMYGLPQALGTVTEPFRGVSEVTPHYTCDFRDVADARRPRWVPTQW